MGSHMAEKKRSGWKITLTVITFGALIVTLYVTRHQIVETFHNLHRINTWPLLLILPLQLLNYHAQTKLYQGLFSILDEKIPYRFMYRVCLELNFVNNLFPSGGVSGFSYLGVRLRSKKISAAKTSLVQLMKLGLIFISFQILLVVGLLFLASVGHVNSLVILIAGSLVTLIFVSTLVTAFVIGSKSRINGFFTYITRLLNKLVQVVRPRHPETLNIERGRKAFTELHENYLHLRRDLGALRKPLMYGTLANLTEVMTIYSVYVAFGHWVNPGAVIIAYAIANFAGLVSVLPGGVGIYEALMTATLATAGVSAALSLPVTVMYRIINMIVQMTPGYVLYQRALHESPDRAIRQ